MIDEFQDVFKEPEGLSPEREHDHAILITERVGPVQVRPYRYAHSQKNEIEKLVGEIRSAGIIKSSTSPYSSPVILVKKKDGSWLFCMDYRSLNENNSVQILIG